MLRGPLLLFEFLEVGGGILVELLLAALTAQLDLLAFMRENERLPHFSEFFAGDEAGFERIGLSNCLGDGCCGGGLLLVARNGGDGDGRERDEDYIHGVWLASI